MKALYSILTTLCILILTACGNSDECQSPIAPKPKGAIRIMTYNVGAICKFIDANFTKENNVQLLADVIKESQTDVVAIQELDSCNTRNDYFQLKSIQIIWRNSPKSWGKQRIFRRIILWYS